LATHHLSTSSSGPTTQPILGLVAPSLETLPVTTDRSQSGKGTSPSVKDRIEKMEWEGVILGYRPVLDYRKLGQGLTAFVHLTLGYPQCCNDEMAEALKAVPGVVEGHYTDGDFDVFLKVVTENPESLRDALNLINGVEGVANTKTIISLTNPIREV